MLKVIAVLTMVIDHLGVLFFPEQDWMRAVGRLTMPVFAYTIARGVYYTSNPRKYLWRLGILAIASQIPFTLLFGLGSTYDFGDLVVWLPLLNMIIPWFLAAFFLERKIEPLLVGGVIVLLLLVPIDYTSLVILLPIFIHRFWFKERKPILAGLSIVLTMSAISLFLGPLQWFSLLAIPLVVALERIDDKITMNKWFFYVFYPGHMMILLPFALHFGAPTGLAEVLP